VSAGGFGGSLSARSARTARRRSRRRAPAAGGRFAGGRFFCLACLGLPRSMGAQRQPKAARSQGVSLEARGWVTFHGAKKIFMIFLRCAAFRASAGCCSVLRIGILAEALREIRWRFDPAFLFRSWQRRLSRALCGIGGAEIEGSRRAFPFRRWQRRLSRALCGTSGAEIGGSQGFSSRCRLLRDWKSLLDIMDIIYSVCLILLLSSSSISILIRSIL
jgi:hypothetical protein